MMKVASMVGVSLGAWMVASVASSAGMLEVRSSGVTRTIECEGRSVEVSGSTNNLTLLGDCPSVVVNGTAQEVKVERTDSIKVSGVGNTVVWGDAISGDRPRIRSTGINNSVEQGTVGDGHKAARAEEPEEEAAPDVQVSRRRQKVAVGGTDVQTGGGGGETVVISDNSLTKTITCDGGEVRVSGNLNTLKIRGECGKVIVSGNRNKLKVEAAGAISTLGNFNDVVWERGVGASRPRVSDLGTKNSVSQMEP